VHYWADLRSVHGFRCDDNIARRRTRNVSDCLYSLCAWLSYSSPCPPRIYKTYATWYEETIL